MPYDMMNPGNPGHEMKLNQWGQVVPSAEFHEIMNEVCSRLAYGAFWHKRLSSQLRKIANRGEGRQFQDEGIGDFCNSGELEKKLGDFLDVYPDIETAKLSEAVAFTLNSTQDLKPLLMDWIKREYGFAHTLCKAVRMAAEIDPQTYNNLYCLWEETSMEAHRAKLLYKRCELAGWNGHDEGILSMIIHHFYEKHPGDKEGNVNLG